MDAPEIKSIFKLALRVGEILPANRAATRAVEATMLGGNAVEIVVCFLIHGRRLSKRWKSYA